MKSTHIFVPDSIIGMIHVY